MVLKILFVWVVSQWVVYWVTNLTYISAILAFTAFVLSFYYPHHEKPHEKLRIFFIKARYLLSIAFGLLLLYNALLFAENKNMETELLANNKHVQDLISDSLNLSDEYNKYIFDTQESLQTSVDSIGRIDTAIEINVIKSLDILGKEVKRSQQTINLLQHSVLALDSMPALDNSEKIILIQNYKLMERNASMTKKSLILVVQNLHKVLLRARDLEVQNANRLLAKYEYKCNIILNYN